MMSPVGQQVVQLETNGSIIIDKEEATRDSCGIMITASNCVNNCRVSPTACASAKSTTTVAFHLLVALTITVVCVNLAMNIFLIRVLQLTRAGMSSMKFSASSGIWLRDYAVFADLLRTTRLSHVAGNKVIF